MSAPAADSFFAGSIPQVYEQYLVPLIFEAYAEDIARRTADLGPARVLEIAAGTGVVTRQLADTLAADVAIVATDLNQPMIDHAAAVGTSRPVTWRQADAMNLPFGDGEFDAVVCQFGVMFFPDKAKAFAEIRRVLRPGGTFLFNVWDRIDQNEFADVVTEALASVFPNDPPRFLDRVPYGYGDTTVVAEDLLRGGFDKAPRMLTVPARSRAVSPRVPAVGFCQGSTLRNEIEAREASRLEEATAVAAEAVGARFGYGAVDAGIQAHVIVVSR